MRKLEIISLMANHEYLVHVIVLYQKMLAPRDASPCLYASETNHPL